MADTRAGFWLLLVIELVAIAIVTITVIAGNEGDKNFLSLFQGALWVVSILLPVLGHPARHQRVVAAHRR